MTPEIFYKSVAKENCFFIAKQDDGNYKGWTIKHGKVVEVRDIGPETVLKLLMTHP